VDVANDPGPVDEQRDGHVRDVVAAHADRALVPEHGEGGRPLRQEAGDLLPVLVDRHRVDGEPTVSEVARQGVERRQGFFARLAPRRPEVHDPYVPLLRADVDHLPAEIGRREHEGTPHIARLPLRGAVDRAPWLGQQEERDRPIEGRDHWT